MIVAFEYDVTFVHFENESEPRENCLKCAFLVDKKCLTRKMTLCRFGSAGYFSLNKITEVEK